MSKGLLGGFEHRVLLATIRVGEGAYTASIVEALEERTGRDVAPSAVYIALQRLERRGLVRSQVRADADVGDRRPRRYFRVTPAALELLADEQRELQALWTDLRLAGEGGKR